MSDIYDRKWFHPACATEGCQSLVLEAEIDRLRAALKEAHQLRRQAAEEIDDLKNFCTERGWDIERFYDPWKVGTRGAK